jgi:hypothetical protein
LAFISRDLSETLSLPPSDHPLFASPFRDGTPIAVYSTMCGQSCPARRKVTDMHGTPMRWRFTGILLLLALCLVMGNSALLACQVPVFRYALERWQPQPFAVYLFYRGPLDGDALTAKHSLEESTRLANVQLHPTDLAESTDDDLQNLYKAQHDVPLPCVIVQGIGQDQKVHTLWAGPLASDEVRQLADSPLRRTIRDKLLAGESAAWVFVDGGDAQQDDAAFHLLQNRLKTLEANIAVPVPDPYAGAGQNVLTDLPLKLSFPILRVSRNDPAEKMFLLLLFGGSPELVDSKEPVVVPVFGRGRALATLCGKEINADGIDEIAMFLGGECSCQVKELNPGYDIIMAADWDAFLGQHMAKPPPRPAVVPAVAHDPQMPAAKPPEPPLVASASLPPARVIESAAPAVVEPSPRRYVLIAMTAAAGVLVILFGWLTFGRKPDNKEKR